jgi:hypothetical protein
MMRAIVRMYVLSSQQVLKILASPSFVMKIAMRKDVLK